MPRAIPEQITHVLTHIVEQGTGYPVAMFPQVESYRDR